MELIFYTANCIGKRNNCSYPNKVVAGCAADMDKVARFDHVCAEYTKGYRNAANFVTSNVVVMDCDNDHSDDPEEWIKPEMMEDMFPDTPYVIVPSRNNMKPKDGKTARPRWHIYFLIYPVTSAGAYTQMKRDIFNAFPFFDGNALDAARFIFGTEPSDIIWHDGDMTIDILLKPAAKIIPAGQRNSTLSRFAGRVVKRYGNSEKAHRVFLQEAEKCEPPLDDAELKMIWNSAVKFGERIKQQAGYIPPEEYEQDFNKSLEPTDYSDIGQARVFCGEYGDEMAFSGSTNFLRYNGICWEESESQAIGAMEEFTELQLQEALDRMASAKQALIDSGVSEMLFASKSQKLLSTLDEEQTTLMNEYDKAKAFYSFVMKRRNINYICSALKAAKPMLEIKPKDLDANPFLLNTPTMTIDLQSGISREKSAADYITKVTETDPGFKGKKEWDDTLDLIFCGDHDLIDYVQKIVGLTVIGKIFMESMIIAYGEGSNGKSTFWNTIARVLGTYSGHISADALMVGCKRNVKPEMAELKGKRLIIAAEPEEGMRLNTSTVKQLCSTDEIYAEKKYKDPFSYVPSHTLVLYTNHLPKVGANDDGIWRRLIVIPFNAKIRGKKDIKNYTEFLIENSGEYILSWIIEGAKKIIQDNFHVELPECVVDAIGAYKEQNDWFGHFIEECCELDKDYSEKSGAVYQNYRAYCLQTGEYTRSTTDFYAAIDKAGFMRRRTKKGVFIHGLKLKDEFMNT